jgi:uncharacterized repeat protein (TIGR03803 family)
MTNVKRKVIESATEMTLQKREIRFSLRAVPAFALLWLAPLHAQSSFTVLHSFGAVPHGAYPSSAVIRDATGNLFGTTEGGGGGGAGAVYEVDDAGHQKVLYSFTGGADGGSPVAPVTADSAANLYGTTNRGGSTGSGVLFKIGNTGNESVLYSFTGGTDGYFLVSGVVLDSAGNLYGAAAYGGIQPGFSGYGTIYKLDAEGNFNVLYTFTGGTDGGYPNGVILDAAGNIYGTAGGGGSTGNGVVFKVDAGGHETVLYNFTGGADGGSPFSGSVVSDFAGGLYGTTSGGGASGAGVVFKLDKSGNETVLYTFTGGADGGSPNGVIRDLQGNLYGTTASGGQNGNGVVFRVDTSGNETTLYTFTGGADGGGPTGGSGSGADVVRDPGGNLYGTAEYGGPGGIGVVFRVDPTGHETVLYGFPPSSDGAYLYGGVIRDSAGNLYGTTYGGGPEGAGTVFKLDNTYHETILYAFTGSADGSSPGNGVVRDTAGNLYGTTLGGGSGSGVVFKVDTSGDETVLYTFTGGSDGGEPWAGVILDPAGNLYGTTYSGGSANEGVVYKLDTSGNETVLHNFTGADGANPHASLIRDPKGNLYGTASGGGASGNGDIFKIDSSGNFSVLYSFTGGNDGTGPYAGVTLDSAGNLYGTTDGCPGACYGAVYKLDTSNNLTVLWDFTGGSDGGFPFGGVVLDAAGNLYGTTAYQSGNVYKLDTAGNLTVLAGGLGYPYAGVIRDPAGNLFGTSNSGGKFGGGSVFGLPE